MTEQEKRMIEMLSQSKNDIEIPSSLNPENIEKMLKHREKTVWWKSKRMYSVMAASIVLMIGVSIWRQMNIYQTTESALGGLELNEGLTAAESYEDIQECLENYQKEMKRKTKGSGISDLFGLVGGGATEGAVAEESTMESVSQNAADGASYDVAAEYSDTNTRTEGVGEADIVKTDGKYLYIMKDNCMEVTIVDASQDQMELKASLRTENGAQISEFYVKGTNLYLFTTINETQINEQGYELYAGSVTQVETYDISNISQPKFVARTTQSGQFQTSRIVGDYIYTLSRYGVYDYKEGEDEKNYIPVVGGEMLPATEIYLPAVPAANQYVVITSMDMRKPGEVVEQKAVLTEYGECYASTENIYIYEMSSRVSLLREEEQRNTRETVIRKISYKDGRITGEAQGSIAGRINDSFSIDEHKGKLRVVTTVDGVGFTTNSVYVLDENMNIIGEINGIAKDERVYSARLYGDIGYFVTYKETDPLFTVDFSDPTNPKIIGQLKIPGFSEYLHFYGKGKLLGIGLDTDEKTGITNGLKLSMFDISEPTDVKETDIYVIEDMYSSDAFWNYKSVIIDPGKNIIGFSGYNQFEEYFIFAYSEDEGFKQLMREDVNGMSYLTTRGVYIGERFFVIKGNVVESYRMGTFEKIDDILL